MKRTLCLHKVSKSYEHKSGEISILEEVDLDLFAGQSMSIIGPSGSGKSTLLSLIAGLEPYDKGTITVLGENLEDLSSQRIREIRCFEMGFVFQQFHLLEHLSALDNVALPGLLAKDPDCYKKAKDLLSSVGLYDRSHHIPTELSGGECQRLAIARALINKPSLLLADEPSGNLDVKTGFEVMDLFFNLVSQHKTSLILVTHNQNLAQKCQMGFELRDKKLHRNEEVINIS